MSPQSKVLASHRAARDKTKGQATIPQPDLMYHFELNCSVVGEGGLEPPRPEGHWHLKPARLPFRHSPVAADCSAGMFVGLGGPTDPRTITVGLVGIQTRLIRLVRAESEGAGWVCGCVWFRRGAARSSPSRLNQQWDAGRLVPRRPGSTNSGTRGGSFLADPAQPAMRDNAHPEHISARRALRW